MQFGIERLPDRFADKGDDHQGNHHGTDHRSGNPPRVKVGPALLNKLTPARRGWRQSESQIIERCQPKIAIIKINMKKLGTTMEEMIMITYKNGTLDKISIIR